MCEWDISTHLYIFCIHTYKVISKADWLQTDSPTDRVCKEKNIDNTLYRHNNNNNNHNNTLNNKRWNKIHLFDFGLFFLFPLIYLFLIGKKNKKITATKIERDNFYATVTHLYKSVIQWMCVQVDKHRRQNENQQNNKTQKLNKQIGEYWNGVQTWTDAVQSAKK